MRAIALLAVFLLACSPHFDATAADPVDVHVLAVDPRDPSPITLHAALCAPTDSRRCDEGPSLDLGVRPLDTTLVVRSEFVTLAQQQDDLKGFGGIRVKYSFREVHGHGRGA